MEDKEYYKKYYQENRIQIRERQKRHYQVNKEKRIAQVKKYKETHQDKVSDREKQYRIVNKELITKQKKDYRLKYLEKHALWERSTRLKNRYGITIEDYNKLLRDQNNCCAICLQSMSNEKCNPSIDHDHETGKVRGLVHKTCNIMIAYANENPLILTNAINYLKKFEENNTNYKQL